MTPKCPKYTLLRRSASIHGRPTAVDIGYGQNDRGSIFKVATVRPWPLSRHIEDIVLHHYRPGRSSKIDLRSLGIVGIPAYAAVRRHSQRQAQSVIIVSFRHKPGECHENPGRDKINGSQVEEYTVDHIVKHVGNGCQRKYVL